MIFVDCGIWLLIGVGIGYIFATKRGYKQIAPSAIDTLDLTVQAVDFEGGKSYQEMTAQEFAVARGPRHIPWSRRKKELEQAARQKRRQVESFREEA